MAVLLSCAPSAFAQGLPKVETTFADGGTLRFYGQINKGVLSYDDGQVTESYSLIDNDNSVSRIGLTYTSQVDLWAYLGTIEVQYAPFSTSTASIQEPTGPSSGYDLTTGDIRKIDNQVSHPEYGTLYLGQGDMASNETAEADLSGTTVIAYAEVEDTASAQLLRETGGKLSTTTIGDAFSNYDGLSRAVRVRYDTPLWSGFGLRTSWGRNLLSDDAAVQDEDLVDVAVSYQHDTDDFKVVARAAYSWKGSFETIADGSFSALHTPTGLNVTAAFGQQDNGSRTGTYAYGKIGWLADLVPWGKTAFAADYYTGSDIAADGSESESTSLSIVQNVTAWNTQVYATWRSYDVSEPKTSYFGSSAVFVGARFSF